MTRDEAIFYLKSYKLRLENSVGNGLDKDIEAFNMAIKALEQECVGATQKCVGNALDMRCDDAISRQAVLDILEKEGHKWGNDYRDWVDAIEEIKKLPPVNPASNISIQITEREKYGRFN